MSPTRAMGPISLGKLHEHVHAIVNCSVQVIGVVLVDQERVGSHVLLGKLATIRSRV